MRKKAVIAGVLVALLLLIAGYCLIPWGQKPGNQPPVAEFAMTPGTGEAPLEVRCDGFASRDPDGTVAAYAWDFGDGTTATDPALTHVFTRPGTFTVTLTVTDDKGASHAASKAITVSERAAFAPILTEIEPPDGAIVGGTEAWIRWRAAAPAKGRVRWRKAGARDFQVVEAQEGDPLLASLATLTFGDKYEYVVEQISGGTTQRSGLRTFTVQGGLAFEPATVEHTVQRDYDQTVTLTLKNSSDKKVTVAARALAQFAELPADIVGKGSVDEPAELAPGGQLELRLAVTAPDATRGTYEIPIETNGTVGLARVHIAQPKLKLSFKVIDEDPRTLAKTIEVHNEGATLADLAVHITPANEAEVRLDPAAGHTFLMEGKVLPIVLVPVLYLEFQSVKAELECRASGQTVRFPLEFKAPEGKRLLGVRRVTQGRSATKDWYCTNKPNTCSNLPGPGGNGPTPESGKPPKAPKPGSCESCDENGAKDYYDKGNELIDLILRYGMLIEENKLGEYGLERHGLKVGPTAQQRHTSEFCTTVRQWLIEDYSELRARGILDSGIDIGGPFPNMPGPPLALPAAGTPEEKQHLKDVRKRMAIYWAERYDNTGNPLYQEVADTYAKLATDDPPPGDFTDGVKPMIEPLSMPEDQAEREKPSWEAAEAQRWHVAYLQAYRTSYARYQGATEAKDRAAMTRQAEAMPRFAALALRASRRAARQRQKMERLTLPDLDKALEAATAGGAAPEAFAHWRKNMAAVELPVALEKALLTAGVPEAKLRAYREKMEALTPDQAKALLGERKLELQIADRMRQRLAGRKSANHWPEPPDLATLIQMEDFARGLLKAVKAAEAGTPALSSGHEAPSVRPGLLEALQRRASFTRSHRGPFAGATAGVVADSSAGAVGWHAGERVSFAWHDDEAIFCAVFDARGKVLMAPQILGKGRWPRLAGAGQHTAVAWSQGDDSVIRLHDGKQWSDEIKLSGREAAPAFAPNGALHAATSTGLWKLGDKGFERVREAAYSQPALVFDKEGRPHVAWRQDSKIVVADQKIDEGERPALTVADDGTLHLAYLSKGAILVRSRKGEIWTDPQKLEAKSPAWPALAVASDGVRLTYLGAAETGPDALWLVRLPDKGPILVPSLAGNVTEASLVVNFGLRMARSKYRPHDLWAAVNDVVVVKFNSTVPEGRYLFPLNPYQVFTSSGRPVPNRVAIRSWHVNGGHYSSSSDYQLIVRTAWNEQYAFAATADELRRGGDSRGINHDQPDLALLANDLKLPVQAPKTGRLELTMIVANLGETASRPARLVLRGGDKVLHRVEVSVLDPGKRMPFKVPLEYDGKLETIVFRLEQEKPDFDPANDEMTLNLWSKEAPAAGGAGLARHPADGPLKVLDHPDPPYLCRFLDVKDGHEVARVEKGRLKGTLQPGKYRLVLWQYQFEGEEIFFPQEIEVKEKDKPRLTVKTGIKIDKSDNVGPLYHWEAVKPDKPNEAVQWHLGNHPVMLVPPGEYRVVLKPTHFSSERLVWPAKVVVKGNEQTTVKLASSIKLDMPKEAGPLYEWEVVKPDTPDTYIQWHLEDVRTMLVPPGEYRVVLKPTHFSSERLVWPAKVVVKEYEQTTVKVASAIKLDMPKELGPLYHWEVVKPDRPDAYIQWHLENVRTMLVPAGEYRVVIKPTHFDSERLVWPAKVVVKENEQVMVKVDSGLRIVGPDKAKPDFDLQVIDANKKVVQYGHQTWAPQALPPGTYKVEVRKDRGSPWQSLADKVVVEAGRIAEVKMSALPGK